MNAIKASMPTTKPFSWSDLSPEEKAWRKARNKRRGKRRKAYALKIAMLRMQFMPASSAISNYRSVGLWIEPSEWDLLHREARRERDTGMELKCEQIADSLMREWDKENPPVSRSAFGL